MNKKRKYGALIIVILISTLAWSQIKISGKVVDSDTRLPIEFATISNLTNRTGIFTTENGDFRITLNHNDTIEISCVGYKTVKLFTPRLENNELTILLTPITRELQEVIVSNIDWTKYKEKRIGYAGKKSNWHVWGLTGLEYAVYVPNEKKIKGAYIWELLYKMVKRSNDTVLVRLHVYEVTANGTPGKELLDLNVVKKITGKMNQLVAYNISDYKIKLPENGVFVGIEWLGVYDPHTNTVLSQNVNEPAFGFHDNIAALITYAKSRNGNWEKRDLRDLYIGSSVEKWISSRYNPNASFGITIKIPR
jgi:hypothetical protein